jgi:hypothetical protein
MIALSNTVHLYARPTTRESVLAFFADVLGLEVHEVTKAYVQSSEPMAYVQFSNGASLSVEFTDDALSDEQAKRGAWLELRTGDVASLQRKALEAGLKRVVPPKTPFFYIQAPGGQVFRIVESTAD